MPFMPKLLVKYRKAESDAKRRCGNCVMFRKPDSCTLVIGEIRPIDVCNEWTEPKKNAKR